MEKRTPFWWTNLYTLLYLRDLGVDPESDRTRHAIELVHSNVNWGPWHGYSPFFEGEEEALHQRARRGARRLLWEA